MTHITGPVTFDAMSGDRLLVTMVTDEEGTKVFVSLDDVDETVAPTAELTLDEATGLADTILTWGRRVRR